MPKREVEIVPAHEWRTRLVRVERLTEAERKEFDRLKRLELSIEDLRDEIVGIVLSAYPGSDQECFENCYHDGGPHPTTLRKWRDRVTYSPRATKMRQAAMACGYDMKWVRT